MQTGMASGRVSSFGQTWSRGQRPGSCTSLVAKAVVVVAVPVDLPAKMGLECEGESSGIQPLGTSLRSRGSS